MRQRILFLRRTYGYGGSEAVILGLLQGIDYSKNSVCLATTADVFSLPLSRLGLPVEVVPITARTGRGGFRVFASWLWFLGRLRPRKVILAEGGFFDFPFATVAAAFLVARGRVYLMEHSLAPEPPRRLSRKHLGLVPGINLWWYRWIWPSFLKGKFARKILAVSKGVRERLVCSYDFPADRTEVIYNGVDASVFRPAPDETRRAARRGWQIPEGAAVIVSTARLDPIKRLEWVIRAFGALQATRDDLWLLLAGDGPSRGELEGLAKSVDLGGRVKFLGHISDVRTVLRCADVHVLPSAEEAFGIALVEAMACKLICVATKVTGPKEIIQHGKNGILVDQSYEGVLGGLQRALSLSHEERESMGTCARETVLGQFRADESVAKTLTSLGINQVGRESFHNQSSIPRVHDQPG